MDQETRAKAINERYQRDLVLDRSAVDVGARTVKLAFSSDKPYCRWWGIEILSHAPGDVKLDRLKDGGALLVNHDTEEQVGVVESCSIDPDGVGRAVVRFSKNSDGEEILVDVADGIRTKTSVGYMVHEMTEIKVEDMSPELMAMCAGEGLKAYLCKWEPYEISIVSVPADVSVGVGRSASVAAPAPAKGQESINITERGAKMDGVTNTPSPEEMAKKMAEMEGAIKSARKAEIEALARQYMGRVPKVDEMRDAAIREGIDGSEFKGRLFDALPAGEQFETPKGSLGMSENEKKQYSVSRLLAHIAGEKVDAGLEIEASRALENKIGAKRNANSLYLPFDVADTLGRRDLSYAGGATLGANLVGTNLQAGEWEGMLRSKSIAAELGVRRMTVSGGNITFPRQTGAATAYWPGEASAFTESTQSFGLVTAMPNEVGTYTDVSRRLLVQGTPSVEAVVREDLIQTIMLSEETQLFSGAGTNYPAGIINTSGVGTVDAANINWAGAVEFETDIQTANADVASMKYAFNAAGAGILKQRAKEAGYPVYLMGDDRRMNGYAVAVSNLVASGYGFFGDWSKALLITWGAIEVFPDQITGATSGLVRFHVFHLMDVAIKQPSAFTYCSNLS